jgi:hypothetical protein
MKPSPFRTWRSVASPTPSFAMMMRSASQVCGMAELYEAAGYKVVDIHDPKEFRHIDAFV